MLLDLGNGLQVDVERQLMELDRAELEDSLYLFLRAAWRHMDPSQWQDGWCIEALAEHLQAVVDGEIRRLLVNIPPRTGKSSILSVALPAWTWAQSSISDTSGPGAQFLYASYAEKLSLRDSVRCRRLIASGWYQRFWGNRFALNDDQNTKHRFGNDKGGERLITSIGGTSTGEGMSIGIADDPNAANEAFSEATIESTNDWWDTTFSTRLNNPKTGAYIVTQQRLAEDDLSGHILSKDRGDWCHLCLPMHYEAARSFVTMIGWKDPRTTEGQLLWPERMGQDEVATLEATLGPFASAGQLEQRPEPKGGGVIKREWWLSWEEPAFPPMDFILASLDTAYTEKTENDYSALTVWGVFTTDTVAQNRRTLDANGRPVYAERSFMDPAPKVMLMNAWRDRLALHELVKKTAETCKKLKVDKLVIESKAAGHSVAQELRRLYGNEDFGVQLIDPKSMDKLARLYSVQHLFAEGMIYAPDRAWADMVITEVGTFPHAKHDDLTDTVSQALRHMRDLGLLVRAPERLAEIDLAKRYVKQPGPLYPV